MTHAELVFVPILGRGHIVSMVEMAKLLVGRDPRLSVTVLIMKLPFDSDFDSYTSSLAASVDTARIRFVHLTCENTDAEISSASFLTNFIEGSKPHVKRAVAELVDSAGSTRRLAGFVLDAFCSTLIDLANEFGVPSYVFFTSSAAFLGLMLHLQSLQDEHHVNIAEFKDSAGELDFPSFTNLLPTKILPSIVLTKESVRSFLEHAKRMRETKGIIVNTFDELEPHAVRSLAGLGAPAVYPVGPILSLDGETKKKADGSCGGDDIMEWLEKQPPSSVVFLCFGSRGSFGEEQVKEMACALERSGHRFLWSLRQPPPQKGQIEVPHDYADPTEVLPEGFLHRTAGLGKVIGWAPQTAILAHPAIGGFVSHCGWNSTLESIWFGMPVATWPLYAEQQFNAFQLVVELGLATEIKMDYRRDFRMESGVMTADVIEGGIRKLMEEAGGERRKKVKEASEKSRKALMEGGSSYLSLGRLIEDILNNMPLT
ncbi:hypothetical protein BT93_A0258 [Corymbia citriodora subsp. variegata]|nr:hypothetical protein BT93_A0258 [Corymbia citriodora subsp. variegata]